MAKGIREIAEFQEVSPSLESYWRSVILFGTNSASYKFAFAQSLMELASAGKTVVTLEDLSDPFSHHICEHLKIAPKQVTRGQSKFLDACKQFNEGSISHSQLLETTEALGFVNVVDAFHHVNRSDLPVRFYEKDYQRGSKKLILCDSIHEIVNASERVNLGSEVESRWNLVETAWALGLSTSMLAVSFDNEKQELYIDQSTRRKDITSARSALSGYQKGHCFYCYGEISTDPCNDNLCDVDHFFPHMLTQAQLLGSFPAEANLNGVWNLVLACKECNRGIGGKFERIPEVKYLERLSKRNEFLIASHHPLRETLILQTGKTAADRAAFLNKINQAAIGNLIARWSTSQRGPALF